MMNNKSIQPTKAVYNNQDVMNPKETQKILEKYKVLFSDWVPMSDGKMKMVVNPDAKLLFEIALREAYNLRAKSGEE
jgi:hypothetical protein